MSESRTCRVCGVRGFVHLDRAPEEGPTVNPLVEYPVCGRTWIAKGTQWAFRLTDETTDEDLEAMFNRMMQQTRETELH